MALFGSSIALRRENVRFGCPKMLNGVVFTIFIPFSFSAISLYKMDESMGSFIRNSSFKLSSVIARQVVAPESFASLHAILELQHGGDVETLERGRGDVENLGTRSHTFCMVFLTDGVS